MFMDKVKQKGLSRYYEISYGKDFNTKYQVSIQRNPCFGLDEEVNAANNSLAAIQKSYAAFKKSYASGKVGDEAGLKTFKDLQTTLATCTNTAPSLHEYCPIATRVLSHRCSSVSPSLCEFCPIVF